MTSVTSVHDIMPAFGRALLRHRRAAGMSQVALARASGISVRALRELERGRANAAQERSAELLAEALGLDGDERKLFVLLAKEGRRRTTKPIDPMMLYTLPVVGDLVGREREMRELRNIGEELQSGVVVVSGPPGVGKTSLAVAAAHKLSRNFPDGCLAIDLYGGDDQPMTPNEALYQMLAALGVPRERILNRANDREELFKILMRDRRAIVLLDNAVDEAHVRPLLGAGPGCMTLVTCRRALTGLTSTRSLPLTPLSPVSAVSLLASAAGRDVLHPDPAAAFELVSLCGHLPLAVRIAGNRLATRPHWSPAYLAAQLRDERMRFTSLSAGDRQVRSVFEVSYRRLSQLARNVFRRLAVIPVTHFDVECAAAATEVPRDAIGDALDELVEASLLRLAAAGRFQFHGLIRLYAMERLVDEEPPGVHERLRDNLLAQVPGLAVDFGRPAFPDVLELTESSLFSTTDAAKDWFERQGEGWSAAQREAAVGWRSDVLTVGPVEALDRRHS